MPAAPRDNIVSRILNELLEVREEQGWRFRKWLLALLALLLHFPACYIACYFIGNIGLVVALVPSVFWGVWLGPWIGSIASFLLIIPHFYLLSSLSLAPLNGSEILELLIAHSVFASITYFTSSGFHLRKHIAEQLLRSEQANARFRGLFDRTSDMVFILGLDGFKKVNDTYGHHIGDVLLKTVAERLHTLVRSTDAICRLGGDEFVVIIEDLVARQDAKQVAEAIETLLKEVFLIEGHQVQIGASTGISLYPDDESTPEGLLNLSDMRMYDVKRKKYAGQPAR